jgi:LysW-gamma-L-lysine/LysW-L-ornithine aminotransferase
MSVTDHQEDIYSLGMYPRRGLTLVRGDNARVWDSGGREYIDCIAGHGSANVGHANRFVAEAVASQAIRLLACSNTFYNDERGEYLRLLMSVAPPPLHRVFFCNSGTEAVEAALKFARHATGRPGIVSMFRGFHGRTLGALSVTHNPKYRSGFGPLIADVAFTPFNDCASAPKAITPGTAAVILEIVQGEGGVHVATQEFLDTVSQCCKEQGALLIVDEVQTGFGRTGRLFAFERFGLRPDIVCIAKSIAGGLPMGATLCSEGIDIPPGAHGSTFGGNPLCCAAASAALQFTLSENLPAMAETKGIYLGEMLDGLQTPLIREIRRLGLMVGIDLRDKAKPYIDALQHEGVLALSAGPTVVRLLPPLTIENADLERVAAALAKVLGAER